MLSFRREVYHPFQNHYTHKITIFKLFGSLQLQFSGPTGINFHYNYSFVGLTGICFYSYSSVQLHKNGLRNYFPKITVTVTKKMVFELNVMISKRMVSKKDTSETKQNQTPRHGSSVRMPPEPCVHRGYRSGEALPPSWWLPRVLDLQRPFSFQDFHRIA